MEKRAVELEKKTVRGDAGYSLLEFLLVISAIVMLVAGALVLKGRVEQTSKIKDELGNLMAMQINITSVFQGQTGFSGLTNAVALAADIFPTSMASGGNVNNKWGGAVALSPAAGNLAYSIQYSGVPTEACIKLAGSVASWDQIDIGGTVITPTTANLTSTNIAACGAAPTVTMTFQGR